MYDLIKILLILLIYPLKALSQDQVELEIDSQSYGAVLIIDEMHQGFIPVQKKILLTPGWHQICVKNFEIKGNDQYCEYVFLVGQKIKKKITAVFEVQVSDQKTDQKVIAQKKVSKPLYALWLRNGIYEQQKEWNLITWVSFQQSMQKLNISVDLWANKQLDHLKNGIQWPQVQSQTQGYQLRVPQVLLRYQIYSGLDLELGRRYSNRMIEGQSMDDQLSRDRFYFLEHIGISVKATQILLDKIPVNGRIGFRQLQEMPRPKAIKGLDQHLLIEGDVKLQDQEFQLKMACFYDCYAQMKLKLDVDRKLLFDYESEFLNRKFLKHIFSLNLDLLSWLDQSKNLFHQVAIKAKSIYQSNAFPWQNMPLQPQFYVLDESIHAYQFDLKILGKKYFGLFSKLYGQNGKFHIDQQMKKGQDQYLLQRNQYLWIIQNEMIFYQSSKHRFAFLHRMEIERQSALGLSMMLDQIMDLKIGYYAWTSLDQHWYVEANRQKCLFRDDICIEFQLLHGNYRPFDFLIGSYWQVFLYLQLGFSWVDRG